MLSSHPRGLSTLFFSEMWERFSYYGMRALLVLYLVNALDYPRADALSVYATYTGLVYLTPVVGGWVADRWLGSRRAVLVGGIVMALGHFAMAFPALLYVGLGLLIAGNGFFKPNISTLVGSLYHESDPRRDGGFTLFYMSINLGGFLAPLVCGTLGELYGWHYGFAAAGVGMILGLVVFVRGQPRLAQARFEVGRGADPERGITARDWAIVAAVSAVVAAAVCLVIALWPLLREAWRALSTTGQLSAGVALLLAATIGRRITRGLPGDTAERRPLSRVELHRVLAIVIIGVFVVFFWMGFEQAGGTMNLFADKLTDRAWMGWTIPASYFQSLNPLTIIVLAPLFSSLWLRWDRSPYALPSVAKQAIGMMILGSGFVVLAMAEQRALALGPVSPGWLVLVYALFTIGELFLSPIGLSLVTKLAPARLTALMMGIWFTAMATANYLAGILESLLAGSGIPLYWFLVASSFGAGLLLLLLTPLIRRLMHGVA